LKLSVLVPVELYALCSGFITLYIVARQKKSKGFERKKVIKNVFTRQLIKS
jgi:hypothetical protein